MQDRYIRDGGSIHLRRDDRPVCEAPIEHGFCRLKTQRTCITAENDGDQMRAIALGRGGEAMPRLAGRAGFQPGRALKKRTILLVFTSSVFPPRKLSIQIVV